MSSSYYDAPRDELVLVQGYRHLAVSRNGKVYNRTNNTYIKPVLAKNKSPKVVTTTAGVTLRFRLGFLIAAAFIPLPYGFILPRDVDKLDLDYVDGDYNNLEIDNLMWVIRPDIPFLLSEAAGEDQIFELKSVPDLAVNRKGDVYNLQTGNKLRPSHNANGYLRIEPYLNKKFTSLMHHRVIGELFVPPKESYTIERCLEELAINHKNSIRDDNRPENLEWVTSKENTEHGYEVGLMVRNQRLEIKDLTTGKLHRFRSLLKFTQFIGLHDRVVRGLFNANCLHKVVLKNHLVRPLDDRELPFLNLDELSDQTRPFYKFLLKDEVALIGRPEDVHNVLPGPVSCIRKDGTVDNKPKEPFRSSSWTVTA